MARSNVEAERGRYGMTKEALSKELGVTPKTYNSYLQGTPIPSNVLLGMHRLFGCSIDYLLGLTETRNH